ncbi:MAG: ABC transporter ATP-binding protein, partial [Schwartzia sp.]|nr:ABC transporter ATP-binding protein [Schwartzia sp. (in: firmicutes)]
MKSYLRLLAYIGPYKKRLAEAFVCIVVAAAANLYLPWVIKDMIDKVLAARDMEMLNLICVGIVVIFFVRGIFYYGQGYLVSYIGQRVIVDVRDVLFRKLQRMPISFFDRHQTGEIMSYISNDVAALQSALVERMVEALTESAIFFGSLVMMVLLDWKLSILTLVTVPLVGLAMDIFGKKVRSAG